MLANFQYDPETIRKVLGSSSESTFQKEEPIRFISTSSAETTPGTLFVPLHGNRDGHDFILDALSKGASYFLVESNHKILDQLDTLSLRKAIIVSDTLVALGKLAEYHRSRFKPTLIAVTGSSGKTTTKEILSSCLSSLGNTLVVTEKNYNNEIGLPFTLFRIDSETRFVICEMGMNHKGEIARLTRIAKPDIAIITNIGSAHIEFFRNPKDIAKAKAEILEGIRKSGTLYYPKSGIFKKVLFKKARKSSIEIKFIEPTSYFQISQKRNDGFELNYQGLEISWNLPGFKILENLSLCIAALEDLGVPTEWIRNGILEFKASEKRLVLQEGNYKILNDTYNANRESMISSLEACSQLSGQDGFYAVLGDIKEVGAFSKKLHSDVGKYAASIRNCKGLFTFGQEAEHIAHAFQKKSIDSKICMSFTGDDSGLSPLLASVRKLVPQGSYILAKASRGMKLERFVESISSISESESEEQAG
ncbi:UDP-N-acetylmuramoylalanyl-D-glutamyl-2, 6-diaminopimelate--D-alanyl-D-alanine ligase [Leptospira perolatii]|uniref:UDP-N-acetylmuramoyl-tripeptide--D-alanyl-D-alanine ligase n=1 Tax=Leptospira perolatii TaxID=2023191 RepID=A0A2M9ZKJ1_9LEPT|nr:UDP-N-acetylmuramoyl-tripeptide--D-alanyl-D-alanine ligase [Leptospira perolatii]PJZ69349.1 UDP-N-acetylmuramoylalanyl-D-glutamyl-2, 6-diaminopimelate--D-alanyl-D-alanine ligase [Leptospira perolatii]PJZ72484.1 UDP-N-acetylmuramoylalanyl-D-glutamyl-2, 6-diaminopimelate--D-alanyl-D-alanine ligase [Leptospira perolatii]